MTACGLMLLASLLGTATCFVASVHISSEVGNWSGYGMLAGNRAFSVAGHLLYGEDYCASKSTSSERPLVVIAKSALCSFETKIRNADYNNVSAIILLVDSELENFEDISADTFYSDAIVIFLSRLQGENILNLINNSLPASTFITIDFSQPNVFNKSKQHALICVAVFSVVFVIGGCFGFRYYRDVIERNRQNVGKKPGECTIDATIEKIPSRKLIDSNDKIIEEYLTCAVCFENYKLTETISSLPCSHIFHKHCICPWLAERRSCPLCKMDVLKHYGLPAASSEESILNIPLDDVSYLDGVSI